MITELERLHALLREKNSEIDEWKTKYTRLEFTFRDEEVIKEENRKLKELMYEKSKKIDELRSKCTNYEIELSSLHANEEKIRELEEKNHEGFTEILTLRSEIKAKNEELQYQKRNQLSIPQTTNENILENEIINLKALLEHKMKEVDDLKSQILTIEGDFDKLSMINQELNSKIMKMEEEIERNKLYILKVFNFF
jgi:hypothetical protein